MFNLLVIPEATAIKLKSTVFDGCQILDPVKGVIDGVEVYILQANLKNESVFSKVLADFEASTEIIINDYPLVGQPVTKDSYYKYGYYIVKCIQSHNLTAFAPEVVPNLFTFFRQEAKDLQWIANEQIDLGFERIYNTVKYRCIQAHQTVVGLTPDITPALWTVIVTTQAWTVGVLYKVNDIVTYLSKEYKCLQQHTAILSWNPVAVLNVLWKLI